MALSKNFAWNFLTYRNQKLITFLIGISTILLIISFLTRFFISKYNFTLLENCLFLVFALNGIFRIVLSLGIIVKNNLWKFFESGGGFRNFGRAATSYPLNNNNSNNNNNEQDNIKNDQNNKNDNKNYNTQTSWWTKAGAMGSVIGGGGVILSFFKDEVTLREKTRESRMNEYKYEFEKKKNSVIEELLETHQKREIQRDEEIRELKKELKEIKEQNKK